MTKLEEIQTIKDWMTQRNGLFSWPTDGCSYSTHCRYIDWRDQGKSLESFITLLEAEV